jgi:L-threonylcarbamoyladenylate synthase
VSPTTAEHVLYDFKNDEVLILDGGHCPFGIESTVLKIWKEGDKHQMLVIRKGGVSCNDLKKIVKEHGLDKDLSISELKRDHAKAETEKLEAPGQFLRHYSPNIESLLYKGQQLPNDKVVLLDFGGTFVHLKGEVKYYRDLSEKGDVLQAIYSIFDSLRWAETLPDVDLCLIAHLIECMPENIQNREHLDGLFDRIFRATSGKLYQR